MNKEHKEHKEHKNRRRDHERKHKSRRHRDVDQAQPLLVGPSTPHRSADQPRRTQTFHERRHRTPSPPRDRPVGSGGAGYQREDRKEHKDRRNRERGPGQPPLVGSSTPHTSGNALRRTQTFHEQQPRTPSPAQHRNRASGGAGPSSAAGPSEQHSRRRSSSPTASGSASHSGSTSNSNSGIPQDEWAAEILRLTNRERRAAGVHTLKLHPLLTIAAKKHSKDQAKHNFIDHGGSDGKRSGDRIKDTGYLMRYGGENVARGEGKPKVVHRNWMESPPHRSAILDEDFDDMGLYVAKSRSGLFHWTQTFGKERKQY